MIHMRSLGKRFVAGILALALLFCLAACESSPAAETAPAAPNGQTVMAPAVSSPVVTPQAQKNQDAPGDGDSSEDDEPVASPEVKTASVPYSEEALEKKLTSVLNSIITDGMSKLEQARAVFRYVNYHIRFVGNTDKSDWQKGAYEGLTMGRGDCFTYYAASRALLTALDIDNLEVRRDGGTTDHWWNLVNCGDGWYHFDTCPRNVKMDGFDGFMFTDEEAAAYSALREDIPNFYSFDASLYPARVGSQDPSEDLEPASSDVPGDQPEDIGGDSPSDPAVESPGAEGSASDDTPPEDAPFIPFPVGAEPPVEVPTEEPSAPPSEEPSEAPTEEPFVTPSDMPSESPSEPV